MNFQDYKTLFSVTSFFHSMKQLFPINIKHRIPTYIIGICHILGVFLIVFGICFPPKYLYIHISLILFMLFSYHIFNNNCFMTDLSNFLTRKKTNPLIVPLHKVKDIVYYLLVISTLFFLFPSISIYNIMT